MKNKGEEAIPATTQKTLEIYGIGPDYPVGFDRVECRPILAKEIICIEPGDYGKDLKEDK